MTAAQGFYRFEAKVISRGGGRSTVGAASYRTGKWATATTARGGKSSVSAAAYRAAAELEDERTGARYDYSRKKGVLGAEIMLPEGAAAWMQDRSLLWNAIETIEKRKDSQLARDFVISLPHQLDHEQRVALTREFVREQFCARGLVADIAWHAPDRSDPRNFHAHLMVAMRRVEGTGFASKKERAPEDGLKHPALIWKEELMRLRVAWANTANKHLEAAGLDIRIDHRSLEARGIDREPEPKQGPLATQIEREGRDSRAGADRRAVKDRNAEREQLKIEHAKAVAEEARIVDLMTHRLNGSQIKPEAPTEEILRQQQKREADLLREMREQDARLQAFKQQAERDADDAKRKREDTAKDEARRHMEGDIASASARYSIALGEQYDVRDPYGSLSRAAMQEYATFHRQREQMREDIAKEKDPDKRRLIELKREIEGCDYMVITSERLADMTEVIVGYRDNGWQKRMREEIAKENDGDKRRDMLDQVGLSEDRGGRGDAQAKLDRERAAAFRERSRELREERNELIEERQKPDRQTAAEPPRSADQPSRPAETSKSNDNKRAGEDQAAKAGERQEGQTEMTDAKRAASAKEPPPDGAHAPTDAPRPQGQGRGGGGRGGR
jgi:hypothetical protein